MTSDAVQRAADFLLTILGDGPRRSLDVQAQARRAGVSGRTLQRAKTQLGVIACKRLGDGVWLWGLRTESRDGGGHFSRSTAQ